MENVPLSPEDDDENLKDDELDQKKAKKRSRLGLFAVENQPDDEKKSWFQRYNEEQDRQKQEKEQAQAGKEKETPILRLVEKLAKSEIAPSETDSEPEVEAVETEIPLEEPSDEELQEVVRPKLVEVIEELESDLEADPVTDPPVEKFRELVKSGEAPDEAFDEVMAELGGEENVEQDADPEAELEPNIDLDIKTPQEESAPETQPSDNYEEEIILRPAAVEQSAEAEETTDAGQTLSQRPTYIPPTPPVFTPGFGPQSPEPSDTSRRRMPMPPGGPGATEDIPENRQASPAAMALIGGIIGYLIGRRRGRIKTEKKLIPIQKKLEKQIEDMQFDLQQKEKKIRVAAAKVENDKTTTQEIEPQIEKTLHQPKPESIGHVVVSAESSTTAKPNEVLADKKPEKAAITDRQIETLNRAELLALSEKIIIDGSSLRQIFETHLIGEHGLRRLIAEQMHGGDLKKALQTEIVEREIDFERDPAVRDMNPTQTPSTAPVNQSQDALSHMLQKASANLGNDEQAAFIRARANYESEQAQKQQQQRRVIDISIITAITVLVVLIIYLILTRG